MFSAADQAIFLQDFGVDVPAKLYGADIKTIRAIVQHEIVADSPGNAEFGNEQLFLYMEPAEYAALEKNNGYTFYVKGQDRMQRGPALMDDLGYMKLQLTKAK